MSEVALAEGDGDALDRELANAVLYNFPALVHLLHAQWMELRPVFESVSRVSAESASFHRMLPRYVDPTRIDDELMKQLGDLAVTTVDMTTALTRARNANAQIAKIFDTLERGMEAAQQINEKAMSSGWGQA
jgi:hypothetical protein